MCGKGVRNRSIARSLIDWWWYNAGVRANVVGGSGTIFRCGMRTLGTRMKRGTSGSG